MFGPRSLAFGFALTASALALPESAVVTVGNLELTASDVRARLAEVPAFQRRALGRTDHDARLGFVERELVPALLWEAEIDRRKLWERPEQRGKVNEALRRELEVELETETLRAAPVTRADAERYYEEHTAEFHTAPKLRLWRMVTGDLERAKEVLRQMRLTPDLATWAKLFAEMASAETQSPDKGDLGFVHSDGSTDVPGAARLPALYEAALELEDGALVKEPVPLGAKYVVVWRRGSVAAAARSFDEAQPLIVRKLERERLDAARSALLERLAKQHVSMRNDELLKSLPATLFEPKLPREGILSRVRRAP